MKKAVRDENPETKPYLFEWDSRALVNYFDFKKEGDEYKIRVDSGGDSAAHVVGLEEQNFAYEDAIFSTMTPGYTGLKEEKLMGSGGTNTCPNCNGSGYATYYYGESDLEAYIDGQDSSWVDKCPMCNGTGKVN